MCGNSEAALCTLQSTGYKCTLSGIMDIWEMSFELVTYARQVSVDRFGVDVSGLESYIKGKCALCRFNIETVKSTESDVGVQCRCIASLRGSINRHAKIDSKLGV